MCQCLPLYFAPYQVTGKGTDVHYSEVRNERGFLVGFLISCDLLKNEQNAK